MFNRGETKPLTLASLILIILLFFVGYLLLIPSADREKLLSINATNSEDAVLVGNTLLVESPGLLSPTNSGEEKKELGSVSLYSTTDKSSDKLANSLYVSRNIFNNNYQNINFKLNDISDLESLGVFFNVMDSKGDLIIKLNDNFIYQGVGVSYEIPVDLPLKLLRSNNKLEFRVSSPGINIFGSNFYDLRDIHLVRTDKFVNKEEIKRFALDKDSLRGDASLEFYINCLKVAREQGALRIYLNDKNIYAGRIICDAEPLKLDIREGYLKDGSNEFKFAIDKGDYKVEDLNLVYFEKSGENPIYYFSVDKEDLYKEFELNALFGRGDTPYRATFLINGESISMVSSKDDYSIDISDYVRDGENYLKIIPKNEFDMTHLEVSLIE